MRVKLREVVWTLVFLTDRGADEPSTCGIALAAVMVVLGVVAMALLAPTVLAGWSR